MPQKNGIEVIQDLKSYLLEIKETYEFESPVFIVVTAYYSAAFEKNAILNGADYCVEKPINIATIQNLLGL